MWANWCCSACSANLQRLSLRSGSYLLDPTLAEGEGSWSARNIPGIPVAGHFAQESPSFCWDMYKEVGAELQSRWGFGQKEPSTPLLPDGAQVPLLIPEDYPAEPDFISWSQKIESPPWACGSPHDFVLGSCDLVVTHVRHQWRILLR